MEIAFRHERYPLLPHLSLAAPSAPPPGCGRKPSLALIACPVTTPGTTAGSPSASPTLVPLRS